MKQKFVVIAALVGLLALAGSAWAHHSLQSEYDIDKSITLKGTISRVEWVNPHVYLYLDVKGPDGKIAKWSLSTLPPGTLRRGGVTRQLLGVGEEVSVLGFQARDGSNLGFLRTITFADGHKYEIWLGDASKEKP